MVGMTYNKLLRLLSNYHMNTGKSLDVFGVSPSEYASLVADLSKGYTTCHPNGVGLKIITVFGEVTIVTANGLQMRLCMGGVAC